MSPAPALAALEASGLLHLAQIEPEVEYLFRHVLIQEAAYDSLVKSQRRRLHQIIGETLEQVYAASRPEIAATLAFHFEQAEAHERALHYFEHSAGRAQAAYANDEAIGFFRAAIRQADHLAGDGDAPSARWEIQAAQLHERLGDVLELTGRLDEARAAYESALPQAAQLGTLAAARLRRKIGRAFGFQFRHAEAAAALELAEQALGAEPSAPDANWRHEWIRIQLERMETHYRQGQWREIARLADRTRPIIEQYGTPALRVYFHDSLISVAERRDRYVISEDIVQNARAMLAAGQESGEPRLIADGEFQLGFVLLMRGDLDEAQERLHAAEALNRRIGNAIFLTYVLTYLGILYRRRGQPEAARPYILEAHTATQVNKVEVHLAVAEGNLAWLCWREGDFDGAGRHGDAGVRHWATASFAYPFKWTAYLPLLAVAHRRGQTAEAVEHARALLDESQQRLPDPLDGALAQAVRLFEAAQVEAARAALQNALAEAERLHYL
jgi:hypothetical protein